MTPTSSSIDGQPNLRVVFELRHPAQVNFFRNVIRRLQAEGADVTIIGLRRGAVPAILEHELGDLAPIIIGRHRGTTFSILFEANFLRFWQILAFVWNKEFDVGVSVGGFLLGAALKIRGTPNIQFDDDPEKPRNFRLEQLTSTELYLPIFGENWRGVKIFDALKEWAYLAPSYFEPNAECLEEYGLEPRQYIFVREVSTATLNYRKQAPGSVAAIASNVVLPSGFRVLLSLEDKNEDAEYPQEWVRLREPVGDIHSLLYYSRLVVSSGDSMAREGAMLGVPSIYCGVRDMPANRVLMSKGLLSRVVPIELPQRIRDVVGDEWNGASQVRFREQLDREWEDVTGRIAREILKYGK